MHTTRRPSLDELRVMHTERSHAWQTLSLLMTYIVCALGILHHLSG